MFVLLGYALRFYNKTGYPTQFGVPQQAAALQGHREDFTTAGELGIIARIIELKNCNKGR
jgi:hypothetical protein